MALDFLAIAADEPRDDLRAAHRPPRASRPERGAAAVPRARRRPALRLHDGAGDRRGARERVQGALASGERGHDPDRRRQGGRRADGDGRGVEAAPHRAQRAARARDRADVRGAGARLPRAAAVERAASSGRTRACARWCRRSRDDRVLARRHRRRSPTRSRAGAFAEVAAMTARSQPRHRRSRAASSARRAARTLTCKGWQQEAALRMLMNNLDPEVAERPDDLVVYGGTGQGRAQLGVLRRDRRARCARSRTTRRCSCRPASRWRLPHARGRAARADRELEPRRPLGDVGALPRARAAGPDDVRPDDRRLVDLHRLAGHRAGHVRDVRRRGARALRRLARRAASCSRPASAAWAARSRSRPRCRAPRSSASRSTPRASTSASRPATATA